MTWEQVFTSYTRYTYRVFKYCEVGCIKIFLFSHRIAVFYLQATMSSVITSILRSTVGLLFNKARSITVEKLKDGDVTDVKLREILMKELSNVNFKLDALSRKDLLSSYTFLKEGVDKLNTFLEKHNDEQKVPLKETSKDVGGETSRMPSGAESGILNEALELSHAMEKLKINPDIKEFESAIKRFRKAREKATEAFSNEALSIQDRILAAKFKVVSEILEWLESPETAIAGCLSSLIDVHSLPAVREMFSVHLNRGVKSMLNKAERVENVKSVMFINYVLYKFVFKLSSKPASAFAWPTIELADRSFNPILHWCEVSTRKSWGGELKQPPNVLILDEGIRSAHVPTVTGRGEIVACCTDDSGGDIGIKVISSTGESKVVNFPSDHKEGVSEYTLGVASDSNNNVYVVKGFRIRTETDYVVVTFVLFVLDENYNVKSNCLLHFIEDTSFYDVGMAINKNNDIIMTRDDGPHVHVCDSTGQLKYKFKLDSGAPHAPRLSISDKNEVMIASRDDNVVQIYTEEGKLKSTIQVPESHKIQGLAFHYVNGKLIVLTKRKQSYHLLYYSEACELETSTCLASFGKDYIEPCIISHPSGAVAIVDKRRITFLF